VVTSRPPSRMTTTPCSDSRAGEETVASDARSMNMDARMSPHPVGRRKIVIHAPQSIRSALGGHVLVEQISKPPPAAFDAEEVVVLVQRCFRIRRWRR